MLVISEALPVETNSGKDLSSTSLSEARYNWGIPVGTVVPVVVVHPMDVSQIATDSLQSAMAHGIRHSLSLLLGANDHIPVAHWLLH